MLLAVESWCLFVDRCKSLSPDIKWKMKCIFSIRLIKLNNELTNWIDLTSQIDKSVYSSSNYNYSKFRGSEDFSYSLNDIKTQIQDS